MASYKITRKSGNTGSSAKEVRAAGILNDLIGEKEPQKPQTKATNAYVGDNEKIKRAEKFIGNKLEKIYGNKVPEKSLEETSDIEADQLLRQAFDDNVTVDGKLNRQARKKAKKQAANQETLASMPEEEASVIKNPPLSEAFSADKPFEKTMVATGSGALASLIPDDGAEPLKASFNFDDPNAIESDDEVFESGASQIGNEIGAKPSVDDVYAASGKSAAANMGNTATLTRIFSEDFTAQQSSAASPDSDPFNSDDEGFVVEKKKKKILADIDEYTSFDQNEEISESFRDKSAKILLATIVMVLVTGALFYLESYSFLSLPRLSILLPGRYGIVMLLIDLQLVFISALLILDEVLDGIKSLFTGHANKNSAVFLSLFAAAVQVIAHLVIDPSAEDITLYSTVAAFFALMTAFSAFLDVKRNYLTFRIIANKQKDKLVATELDLDCDEALSFKDTITEDDRIYTITKARFIDGFFGRLSKKPQCNSVFKISLPLIFIISVAYSILNYTSNKDVLGAINAFSVMMLIATPVCSVFINSLPFLRGSKKAAKNDSAIIGEAAIDDYSQASVVSFNDTEVFPPKGVKVTSVRTFGENRIDRTILYAAKIFETVGGPLSVVFTNSISGIIPQMNEEVRIIEQSNGGICAMIDDKEIYVGSKEYMLSYDFGFIRDDIDASFESNVGRIMYMAIGEDIAAKFYIRYSMNRSFNKLMASLIKSGICPSIKTSDPNIDASLVSTLMGLEDCPVGIVRLHSSEGTIPAAQNADSGIVSGSSIAGMLKTFVLCDRIRSHIGMGTMIKFISIILGVFLVGFLYFIGRADSINMLHLLCYQALWLLPVVIPSYCD